MLVALQLVGTAATPLNFTVLVPCVGPKFAPAIVTDVPITPDAGFRLTMLAGEGLLPPPGLELPVPLHPTVTTANAKMNIHRTNCLMVSLKGILFATDNTMSGLPENSRLAFNPWRAEQNLFPQLVSPFVSGVSSKAILFLESHIKAFGN
jgi:hypothetical protein